jgi:hypothetical protein
MILKKGALLFITLTLLIITNINAIEITLSKSIYSPFETLQAEITGNFISLSNDNVFIYNNNEPRLTPVISGLFLNNNVYYYYAVLPKIEGNYSLRILNAEYTKEGVLTTEPIIKDFYIEKNNYTFDSLSINPGFIVTSKDFSINIKSPFKNQLVKINYQSYNKTVSLIEDQEKTIDFLIKDINVPDSFIYINNYKIPVFILNLSGVEEKKEIRFYPESIDATVVAGSTYFFQIMLENTGNKNLSEVVLSNNLGITISPNTIPDFNRFDKKIINVSINIPKDAKSNMSGIIYSDYEGKSSTMNVYFSITKNQSQVNLSGTTILPGLSCSKLKGLVCIYPEKCTGETQESLEGPCCIGECKVDTTNKNDYNWIFGLVALAVIALIAFFLIKNSKKKPKTAEQLLDEKTQKFEKRMSNEPGTEVKDKLARE